MKGAHGISSQIGERRGRGKEEVGRDKAKVTRGITLEDSLSPDGGRRLPCTAFQQVRLNRSSSPAVTPAAGAQTLAAGAQQHTPQVGATWCTSRSAQWCTLGRCSLNGVPEPKSDVPAPSVPVAIPKGEGDSGALEGRGGGGSGPVRGAPPGEADAAGREGCSRGRRRAGQRAAWAGRARKVARSRAWLPMPGCAGILRHFKVRSNPGRLKRGGLLFSSSVRIGF